MPLSHPLFSFPLPVPEEIDSLNIVMVNRIFLTLLLSFFVAQAGKAETHQVLVHYGMRFVPQHITIRQGDTVEWYFISSGHPIQSGRGGVFDGIFSTTLDRDALPAGTVYRVTFTRRMLRRHPMKRNRYHYFCPPHWQHGMVGSVRVRRLGTARSRLDIRPVDLSSRESNW